MNLAKHQGGSMQLTSRIVPNLGLIFSINHQLLARPWIFDMHLSAPAGTPFIPYEPGMPTDVCWSLQLQ